MKMIYVTVAVMLIGMAMSAPPIPAHPEGILYKPSPLARARLDIYEDLLCKDCKNFDPPFKAFLNTTYGGRPVTDYVEVYFHTYILPIHINAFTMSQMIPFLWDKFHNGTVNAAFNEWCFANQAGFQDVAGMKLNQFEVMEKLCTETDGLFGYTKAECLDVLQKQTYKMTIHNAQKFGALNRVYTTPGVFLNGVEVDPIPATATDWKRFLVPYFN
eukprot:CAMPEP_0168329558 /NCGR_PEP_ID=MMETSP0213-20121227/7179_1 /TAXON_ID=151035 /ORGANISM="Euplotes harpa, Strain FSP1.4" /LENGTH=214 /DNA_ID=CAMNT_0008332905 /DNA_START=20 /DNA_END=664 /DNA_ORIENTATION=+